MQTSVMLRTPYLLRPARPFRSARVNGARPLGAEVFRLCPESRQSRGRLFSTHVVKAEDNKSSENKASDGKADSKTEDMIKSKS